MTKREPQPILGAGVWYWVALILAGLAAAGDVIARVAA
jgi:hypothetical protein